MNWKDWPCWAKVAIAVGFAVFVFNWPKSSGEWASWVQAIGAIGAIVTVTTVFKKETDRLLEFERKQIERERLDIKRKNIDKMLMEKAKIDAVISLMDGVLNSIEQCLVDERARKDHNVFLSWIENAKKQADFCTSVIQNVPLYLPPYSFLAPSAIRIMQQEKEIIPAIIGIADAMSKKNMFSVEEIEKIKKMSLPIINDLRMKIKLAREKSLAQYSGMDM